MNVFALVWILWNQTYLVLLNSKWFVENIYSSSLIQYYQKNRSSLVIQNLFSPKSQNVYIKTPFNWKTIQLIHSCRIYINSVFRESYYFTTPVALYTGSFPPKQSRANIGEKWVQMSQKLSRQKRKTTFVVQSWPRPKKVRDVLCTFKRCII